MQVNKMQGWLLIGSLIVFSAVSWMIWVDYIPFIQFEKKTRHVFERLFGHPTMTYDKGLANSLLTFLATYGSAPFLSAATVIIAIFLLLNKQILLGLWFLGVVSSGGIFGIFLKRTFQRERPVQHLAYDSGFSFPSGHAIASTLFFLTLLLVFLPTIDTQFIRLVLTALILLTWLGILFSRLYFHAHHLGDLIVGLFYGVFWVQAALVVYQRLQDYFLYFKK